MINLQNAFKDIFCQNALIDIYQPFRKFNKKEIDKWISIAHEETNNIANYLIILDNQEKKLVDEFISISLHESLTKSFEKIRFGIFNIFSIITETEATFYDEHISDYFSASYGLSDDDLYLVSYKWSSSLEFLHSVTYDKDLKIHIKNDMGLFYFRLEGVDVLDLYPIEGLLDKNGYVNSVLFYTINFIYLWLSVKTISMNLVDRKKDNSVTNHSVNFVQISKYNDFKFIVDKYLNI